MSQNLVNTVNKIIESGAFKPEEDFGSLLESTPDKYSVKESSIVEGKVVAITADHVVVDVGMKGEGFIDIREFKDGDGALNVKVGDKVEVVLESMEGYGGRVILSKQKVIKEKVWAELKVHLEQGNLVEGLINGKVKGGYTVDMGNGVIAFLPGSQVDVRQTEDINVIAMLPQQFKIMKMDERRGNIVLSRRAVLEKAHREKVRGMLDSIEVGAILEGTVKGIAPYGVFVDLGFFDGLAHIRDLSWSRISSPSEVLKLGERRKFEVLSYNPEKQQVTLGVKQLTPNPWLVSSEGYNIGDEFDGRVSNITDYGIFVSVGDGIEGLVHVTEISWSKSIASPRKMFHLGDKVRVKIVDIDREKQRVSLSMKQCQSNPWKEFAEKHQVGAVLDGVIKNIAEFGLFVGFEEGVDGLVHISDIDWDPRVRKNKMKDFAVDQALKVKVLAIDADRERIALSIKHLTENPLMDTIAGFDIGQKITCTVKDIKGEDIVVSLNDRLSSVIKKHELAKDKSQQRSDRFKIGEEIEVKVVNVDTDNGRVEVSIRALETESEQELMKEHSGSIGGGAFSEALLKAEAARNQDKETEE